jgi:hypothetical protein
MEKTMTSQTAEIQQPFVEFKGSWQGTSNITSLRVLYSIKNRKFIKGYYKGCRGKGEIIYRLLPGTYIYFFYFGWGKTDPPNEIKAEILRLSEQGLQTISKAIIKFYNSSFLQNFPPQLLDLYKAKPSYHGYPTISFDKIYSFEENNALIELINRAGEYIEGDEHE